MAYYSYMVVGNPIVMACGFASPFLLGVRLIPNVGTLQEIREQRASKAQRSDWAPILAYVTGTVDQELVAQNECLTVKSPHPEGPVERAAETLGRPMPPSTATRGTIAAVYSRSQSQRDLRIRHGQG